MLSIYKSHHKYAYTEVTEGSEVIEVGLIVLRFHCRRQWISQINDTASSFRNITMNK
jgi:hypothetical protein